MKYFNLLTGSLLALTVSLTGCVDSSTSVVSSDDQHSHGDHSAGAAHSHPTEGPHHGALIELGAEEYHGELIHDEETGTVTIWILDRAAKATVPIKATEITVNLKHSRGGEQFRLAAAPDAADPDGMSSRFVSGDGQLGTRLHLEDAEAMLALSIAGSSYRGVIPHDHNHGDHDHDHGGHGHGGHDHGGHDHDGHDHDHAGHTHDRH